MQGASSNSITIQFLLQSIYDCTSNVSIMCVIRDGQPHNSELREQLPRALRGIRPHDEDQPDVRVIEIHKYTKNNSICWDFTQQGFMVTRQLIQDDGISRQPIQKIHNFFEYEWQKSVWQSCNIVFVCIKGADAKKEAEDFVGKIADNTALIANYSPDLGWIVMIAHPEA